MLHIYTAAENQLGLHLEKHAGHSPGMTHMGPPAMPQATGATATAAAVANAAETTAAAASETATLANAAHPATCTSTHILAGPGSAHACIVEAPAPPVQKKINATASPVDENTGGTTPGRASPKLKWVRKSADDAVQYAQDAQAAAAARQLTSITSSRASMAEQMGRPRPHSPYAFAKPHTAPPVQKKRKAIASPVDENTGGSTPVWASPKRVHTTADHAAQYAQAAVVARRRLTSITSSRASTAEQMGHPHPHSPYASTHSHTVHPHLYHHPPSTSSLLQYTQPMYSPGYVHTPSSPVRMSPHDFHQIQNTQNMRPVTGYADLITVAIMENGRMTVKMIYEWFQENFSYFRQAKNQAHWKTAVRHSLSAQKRFIKGNSKESKYTVYNIEEGAREMCYQGGTSNKFRWLKPSTVELFHDRARVLRKINVQSPQPCTGGQNG